MIVNLQNSKTLVRSDIIDKYYNDIRKFNALTDEEEKEQLKKYLHGTPKEKREAEKALVESNQRFVVAVAKHYGNASNLEDLIQEGNIGLLEALESFQEDKGVKLTTWAVFFIRRAINLYLINDVPMVRKPNAVRQYNYISKIVNEFLQENQRQPTPDEILEIMETKYNQKLAHPTDVLTTTYDSIDEFESVSGDKDSRNQSGERLYENTTCSVNDYEKTSEREYATILTESLLDRLTGKQAERNKEIIKMSFGIGYGHPMSPDEISTYTKVGTERIRQLKNEVLEELQEYALDAYKKI